MIAAGVLRELPTAAQTAGVGIGVAGLVVVAVGRGGHVPATALALCLLASLVGYGIFNTLLSRNPSAAVVAWVLLAPVVAMGSAWALLDQRPNLAETLGGLVLILGVLVALRSRRPGRLASVAIDPQLLPSETRPASSLATGTRNGEQET